MLIDFFEKIDNFTEKDKPISLVLEFFLLNIPFILDLMSPVCILLAGVITLGLLNNSNELIALKASGIPLKTIIKPLVWAGMAFTFIFLVMSQFVLPVTVTKTNKIWNEDVKGKIPLGIYRNGRYYYRGKEGFYSFSRPSPNENKFYNFSYAVWDENYNSKLLVSAEGAIFYKGLWKLYYGQIQTKSGNSGYQTEVFSKRSFDFAEKPSQFFIPEYRSKELSLVSLFRDAKRSRSPDEASKAWAEFYGRISYTLLGLPLMLLGLPMLLMVYRKWGRDLSLAIPVSCGLAFVCWGVWSTLQSLAKANYVAPFFAAVSVQGIICLLAVYFLLREDL